MTKKRSKEESIQTGKAQEVNVPLGTAKNGSLINLARKRPRQSEVLPKIRTTH